MKVIDLPLVLAVDRDGYMKELYATLLAQTSIAIHSTYMMYEARVNKRPSEMHIGTFDVDSTSAIDQPTFSPLGYFKVNNIDYFTWDPLEYDCYYASLSAVTFLVSNSTTQYRKTPFSSTLVTLSTNKSIMRYVMGLTLNEERTSLGTLTGLNALGQFIILTLIRK